MNDPIFNVFSTASDPKLKASLDVLYQKENTREDAFRRVEVRDKTTNLPVLLFQVRTAGRWQTVMAVNSSGNLYLKGTATTYDDFDTLGWNPAE